MRRISTRMSLQYCLVFLHQRQNVFDIKANIILSDSKAFMPILCCLCDQVRCADMVEGITRHAVRQWLVIFGKYCGVDTMKSMQFEMFRNGLFSFFLSFLFFFNLSLGRVPWHGIGRQVLQTGVEGNMLLTNGPLYQIACRVIYFRLRLFHYLATIF